MYKISSLSNKDREKKISELHKELFKLYKIKIKIFFEYVKYCIAVLANDKIYLNNKKDIY